MPTPRPEYPHPHFDRSHAWVSLNGTWDFRADPSGRHTPDHADGYDQHITVPFAWETPASGIAAHWLQRAWYRRTFTVPADWQGQRVILHFGAVHHQATVWVNRVEVARHEGGYTPFSTDVTDALREGEQELVVRVHAPADKLDIVHGKQRSMPRDDYDGVCFTPSSGIWQSVWLTPRPLTHLTALRLRPAPDLAGISVEADVRGPGLDTARLNLRVREEGRTFTLDVGPDGRVIGELPLEAPRLWSPEDPHLYHVDAELSSAHGSDRVSGYTGLRSISVDGETLRLNGRRLFVRGVLDQGYWPDTGITAPDDAALRKDLEIAADAGYNLVRKHLKLEDPRYIHHADTLGMLLWAEPASPGRFSPASTARFAQQIEPMVDRDGNSPAIVIWGLYNEEWGLDWDLPGDPAKQQAVADAYDRLKALDPTRPVVDNSGWTHVRTDLLDWHYYDESAASWATTVDDLLSGRRDDFPVRLSPDFVVHKKLAVPGQPLRGLPNLNGEYGGGFTGLERAWHLRWQTQELRRHDRLAGYVYTELYDIEHESAGLLDFHRRPKDLAGVEPAHVNAPTTLVLDITPVAPGRDLLTGTRRFTVDVRVSHHGSAPVEGLLHAAWTPVYAPTPPSPGDPVPGCRAEAKPYVLGEPVTVAATLPEGWTSGRLHLALVADSTVVARTALDVDTRTALHVGDDPLARPSS
ncbi:glycoside hydrolase family 2 protein [Streptomyces sp. NRRL B-24085]|uniref:glycoside hydrolase family 2 protein n=1 Tax=Streptomyces sp. NRRL B-24085 TaxID=1709476 RepID=UPI0006B37D8A|nr:glycoside hydrolase family 2 [Streptomyces sp. NRRL B-24085]